MQDSLPLPHPGPGSPELALTGLVFILGGLALVPIARFLMGVLVPEREVFFARWGFLDLARVLLLAIALAILLPFGARGLGVDVTQMPVQLALTSLSLLAATLLVVGIAQRAEPEGWRALGVKPGRNARATLAGVSAYVLAIPLLLGTAMAWPWLLERLGGESAAQEITAALLEQEGLTLAWMLALAILVQPLLEELLFRSFLQPLLVQNLGDRGGIVLTSVAFAALHGASAFMAVFALSLLLGTLMLRTRRLVAVWGVHALHNGLMLLMLFSVPESREVLHQDLLGWLP